VIATSAACSSADATNKAPKAVTLRVRLRIVAGAATAAACDTGTAAATGARSRGARSRAAYGRGPQADAHATTKDHLKRRPILAGMRGFPQTFWEVDYDAMA
jgi:hypothetical protein